MKRIITFFILSISAIDLCSQIPVNGLVGYYPFTGNANDASGNGNHGTNASAQLTMDRFCNPNCAYSFGGQSYIQLPSSPYVNQNVYSYSVWFKAANTANDGLIFCMGGSGDFNCQGLTYQTSGKIFAGSYNNGSSPLQSYISGPIIPIQKWTHIVVTRDSTTLKMYVNGAIVQSSSAAITNSLAANYGNSPVVTIGKRSNNQDYFVGDVDDIRIYSRVINASEALALYNEKQFSSISVNSPSICSGQSATLSTTNAFTGPVQWYVVSTNFPSIATGNQYVTTVLSGPATYTYIVKDGCQNTATAVITVAQSPTINAVAHPAIVCNGEKSLLTVTGASSYTWSIGSNDSVLTVKGSGQIVLNVSGTAKNCTAKQTVMVEFVDCNGIVSNNSPATMIGPSPVSDELIIFHEANELTGVQIFDDSGKKVGEKVISGETVSKLDVAGLTPGIYMVRLISRDRIVRGSKVIVSR